MPESFLKDIALVLGVAALTSTISHKFRLPSILGYLIAGLIIGPYIQIPLFADPHRVESLSEFGVILVMFSIGLEFSLAKFFRVLPTSGITAALEIGAMFMLGISVGYMFGWSTAQSIFMGGALAISSTMIVSKIFEDSRPTVTTREHVLGILVIQDLVAILLLTVLGAFAVSKQLSLESIVPTISKLLFTLIFLTIAGLFIIPKYIRYVSLQKNMEVLIIASTGVCFVLALLVKSLGYSVALGAFLAGILVAESGKGHKIERLSKPVKDIFVAIFFVSIGMAVDPLIAIDVFPQSLLISLMVIVAQFVIVFFGSVLSGSGMNRALFASLTLGQIGEFSFIIAAIGVGAGMVTHEFQAIIVSVAILTSLSTPILWKNSEHIVEVISNALPSKFRITIGLYEAWFNRMREGNFERGRFLGIPKKVLIGLFVDVFLLIVIPPLILKFLPAIIDKFGIAKETSIGQVILFGTLAVVITPILYGFAKMSSALIIRLSQTVFDVKPSNNKEISQSEKLFKLTLWSILCLLVSFPLLSVIRPFLDTFVFIGLVLVTIVTILYRLWVSAGKVAFEYEAGGEKIVSVIRRQTFSQTSPVTPPQIPGLDGLEPVEIISNNIIGKTLAELNIRNQTGATIVSIARGESLIMFPSHTERMNLGDILHIWGSQDAKEKCKELMKR